MYRAGQAYCRDDASDTSVNLRMTSKLLTDDMVTHSKHSRANWAKSIVVQAFAPCGFCLSNIRNFHTWLVLDLNCRVVCISGYYLPEIYHFNRMEYITESGWRPADEFTSALKEELYGGCS
jgi:hypothetical protein